MIQDLAKSAWVREQLAMLPGLKRVSERYTFVLCPYHSEKTPSGQIFHDNGFFHCRGCGHKANWDTVAPLIGLQPYKRDPKKPALAAPIMLQAKHDSYGFDRKKLDELQFSELPSGRKWRYISTDLLKACGCRLATDEWGQQWIFMPTLIHGKLRGYTRARMQKQPDAPSYIMAKGTWSKAYGLFPFDYAVDLMRKLGARRIVLVEGQRDALRLLSYGIPALCIHGTNGWNANSGRLLELAGVDDVIVMMDGDPGGIRAALGFEKDDGTWVPGLKELLAPMFNVHVFRLWRCSGNPYPTWSKMKPGAKRDAIKSKLWDPGNCPESILRAIKARYFGGKRD